MTNPNKNTKVAKIEISAVDLWLLTQLGIQNSRMLDDLIERYEEESYLKKHHKAYLHVRDAAEKAIEEYKPIFESNWKALYEMEKIASAAMDKPHEISKKAESDEIEDNGPCVIMRLDDLHAMQQDMIDLTDAIDLMARYYIATKYAAPVNKQHYDDTVHEAKDLADQVFRRWENSTIEEIK